MKIILGILAIIIFIFVRSLVKYRKKWNDPTEKAMRIYDEVKRKS